MGVTYKLKQEVIDFIILNKRDDPSLSCRKLVGKILSAFNLEVSKSSVNAVIKDFNLSNPVGRQPKAKPAKIFNIPDEKKQALRAQVKPFLPAVVGEGGPTESVPSEALPTIAPIEPPVPVERPAAPETPAPPDLPALPQSEQLPEPADISRTPSEEFVVEPVVPLVLRPDPMAMPPPDETREVEKALAARREEARPFWGVDDGPLLDGAGWVFPLASLWQIDPQGILTDILAQDRDVAEPRRRRALQAAFVMRLMGVAAPSSAFPSGLAAILEVPLEEANDVWQEFSVEFRKPALKTMFESMAQTLSARSAAVELVTNYQNKIYLNGLCYTPGKVQSENPSCLPLFSMIERTANTLINNIEPLICLFPDGDALDKDRMEMLRCLMGGTDEKVDSARILSDKGDLMSEFLRLPPIHRAIMIISRHTEAGMENIVFEALDKEKRFFHRHFNEPVTYIKGVVRGMPLAAYIFTFRDELIRILTNLDERYIEQMATVVCSYAPLIRENDKNLRLHTPQLARKIALYGSNEPQMDEEALAYYQTAQGFVKVTQKAVSVKLQTPLKYAAFGDPLYQFVMPSGKTLYIVNQ